MDLTFLESLNATRIRV